MQIFDTPSSSCNSVFRSDLLPVRVRSLAVVGMGFSDVALMAYIAIGVNCSVLVVGIVCAVVVIFFVKKQGVEEIHKAAAIFPTALESINYSEIPIAVVAVIADHMQISLDEVAQEYAKDAAQRKVVVLQTFRKDPITDRFIEYFPSKFIQHGYVGEELLQA